MTLVLASTSPYRRALLERFALPFEIARPEVDESAQTGEDPTELAQRLAIAKAQVVMPQFAQALIIGSDQVAVLDGEIFGKPGNREAAVAQLLRLSGKTAIFHTALAVINSQNARIQCDTIPTQVRFRHLSKDEILRYVDKEPALDCAGSAKAEALGICLLDALSGDDPSALIGLPLIALSKMLRAEGIALP